VPLHVLITGDRGAGWTVVFNRDEQWVAERIIDPWERGEDLVVNGSQWALRGLHMTIRETADQIEVASESLTAWNAMQGAVDRTNDLIKRASGGQKQQEAQPEFAEDRRKVMVVVGRDKRLVASLFTFLRTIDLQPQEWSKLVGSANSAAPYIGQVLDAAFSACQAVVVLLTPDDVAYLRHDLTPDPDRENEGIPQGQARPNVFYEAGMAIAKFPTRTVFVEVGDTRAASDLSGIHAVRMGERAACRRDLAQRLSTAGCEVDESGTDWLSAGDFSHPTITASVATKEDAAKSSLVRRIDVFMAELTGPRFASEFKGGLFNELVTESGVTGIPLAPQMNDGDYRMAEEDMKMLLGQVKLKL
jgi:predicted nucleotide-binding protein